MTEGLKAQDVYSIQLAEKIGTLKGAFYGLPVLTGYEQSSTPRSSVSSLKDTGTTQSAASQTTTTQSRVDQEVIGKVVSAIRNYHQEHGRWPNRQEASDLVVGMTDLNANSAYASVLRPLSREGHIKVLKEGRRNLYSVEES